MAWRRELYRFGVTLWRVMKGTWRVARGRAVDAPAPPQERHGSIHPEERDSGDDEESVYGMFLRGEVPSDDDEDDDAEFDPDIPISHSDDDGYVSGSDDEDVAEETEAISLYTDLSDAAATSTSAPLLLAHMTDTSASPLTRRRYSRLVSLPTQLRERTPCPEDDDLANFVLQRRQAKASTGQQATVESEEDSTRRNCVICTTEARDIICWPCRCLAICDDCRQNMASRSAASKHICPCCRRGVDGYSKIYIP